MQLRLFVWAIWDVIGLRLTVSLWGALAHFEPRALWRVMITIAWHRRSCLHAGWSSMIMSSIGIVLGALHRADASVMRSMKRVCKVRLAPCRREQVMSCSTRLLVRI